MPELPAPEPAAPVRMATSAPAPIAPAAPEPAQAVQPYDEGVPGEGPPTGALYLAGGVDDAIPVHGTAIGPDTGSVTIYPPDTGSIPVIEDPAPNGSLRPAPPGAETGTGWPSTTGDPGQAADAAGDAGPATAGTAEPGTVGTGATDAGDALANGAGDDVEPGEHREPGAPPARDDG